MSDSHSIAPGLLILLAFVWRFARTHQLYLTSLEAQRAGSGPSRFEPHDLRSFVDGALLAGRSLEPTSFFVRAFVFADVSVCLLPFKGYEPPLIWLVIALIALYVPWCILHGVMLKRRLPPGGGSPALL